MFRIELLPADHGDCLLLTYGPASRVSRILIDGGTEPTFARVLRDRIGPAGRLELFVVTHIDADHVGGAIPLVAELTDLTYGDVWFNGVRHLAGPRLLSTAQGDQFSRLLIERSLPWNEAFAGHAVQVTAKLLPAVTLPEGLRLTVLSPTARQLARLRGVWQRELLRHSLAPGVTHQYRHLLARQPNLSTIVPDLAATKFHSDTSKPNGSSIAFRAEYDDHSALLTGDAHPLVLQRSIERLICERSVSRLKVDAVKVAHHGSRGNTSTELLQLLDCPRYLPDNEAIGRIIHSSHAGVELVFNYRCPRTRDWDSPELQARYRLPGPLRRPRPQRHRS